MEIDRLIIIADDILGDAEGGGCRGCELCGDCKMSCYECRREAASEIIEVLSNYRPGTVLQEADR